MLDSQPAATPKGGRHRITTAFNRQLDDVLRIEVSRGQINGRTGPLDRHVYRSPFGLPVFLEQLVDNIRAGNISDGYFRYRWVLHEDEGWRREPL